MTTKSKRGTPWTVKTRVHFQKGRKGRRRMREGRAPRPRVEPGNVPRVARVLALAHRFEALVESGAAADYADVARLAGITRQRVSQITALLRLAPDIQEEVLHLPRTVRGRDAVRERDVRAIAMEVEWGRQREAWEALAATNGGMEARS